MSKESEMELARVSGPKWIIPVLFAVLAYFPLFLHLDALADPTLGTSPV